MVLFFVYSREVRRVLPDPRYFLLAQVWSKNTHRAAACGVYLMSATLANNLIITGLPTATTTANTTTTARTTTTTATTNGLPNRYLCMYENVPGRAGFSYSLKGELCTPPPSAHCFVVCRQRHPLVSFFARDFRSLCALSLSCSSPLALSVSRSPSPFLLWFSPDFF